MNKAAFTTQEARELGISPRTLNYLLKSGHIERVAHGTYILSDSSSIDFIDLIKEATTAAGKCIIGYHTALYLFDATDSPPEYIHLITPYGNTPKKKLNDVKFHRSRKDLSQFDVTSINSILVTSFEQTIINLLNSNEPLGTVLNAMRRYRQSGRIYHLNKLVTIAAKFRCKQKTKTLIEAINDEN